MAICNSQISCEGKVSKVRVTRCWDRKCAATCKGNAIQTWNM